LANSEISIFSWATERSWRNWEVTSQAEGRVAVEGKYL